MPLWAPRKRQGPIFAPCAGKNTYRPLKGFPGGIGPRGAAYAFRDVRCMVQGDARGLRRAGERGGLGLLHGPLRSVWRKLRRMGRLGALRSAKARKGFSRALFSFYTPCSHFSIGVPLFILIRKDMTADAHRSGTRRRRRNKKEKPFSFSCFRLLTLNTCAYERLRPSSCASHWASRSAHDDGPRRGRHCGRTCASNA